MRPVEHKLLGFVKVYEMSAAGTNCRTWFDRILLCQNKEQKKEKREKLIGAKTIARAAQSIEEERGNGANS